MLVFTLSSCNITSLTYSNPLRLLRCPIQTHYVINQMQEGEAYTLHIICPNVCSPFSSNCNIMILLPSHSFLLYCVCLLTLTHAFISGFTLSATSAAKVCTLQNSFQPGFVARGDYIIGGIFPLHYNQEMPDLNCTYRPPPVKCNG